MVAVVWNFETVPGQGEEFERFYGVDGEWTKLSRRSRSFLGSSFLKDIARPERYAAGILRRPHGVRNVQSRVPPCPRFDDDGVSRAVDGAAWVQVYFRSPYATVDLQVGRALIRGGSYAGWLGTARTAE